MTSPAEPARPAARTALPAPPTLSGPERDALFLDFDGTLVDIAHHPDAIEVASGLPELLHRLNEHLSGRLAIVSGRAIADLDRHLGRLPVAIAGSHGGEFRASGSDHIEPLSDPLPEAATRKINALAERLGGLFVEAKPFGAAIHYRGRPEVESEVLASAEQIAQDAGLTLKRGKMVAELVMSGTNKGRAVDHLMKMPDFTGARPIFAGDDITDEDAFRSVLDYQGGGVLVGNMRDTVALWQLEDVSAVYDWLKAALA